jgi:glutamine---fructose-6-phosphate transaminase (isomerizing)
MQGLIRHVPRRQSILEAEIRQQPTVLRESPSAGQPQLAAAANALRGAPHLLVAAHGSSAHAGDFARYHYADRLQLLVSPIPPALFADPAPGPALGGAALLAISQSGASPDLVATVRKARHCHSALTLALTNSTTSQMAREAEHVIDLRVGDERSVAATKTYTGAVLTLAHLGHLLAPDEGVQAAMATLPDDLGALTDALLDSRPELFTKLRPARGITVVGRGIGHSAALETALKLREVGGIMTEAFSPETLLHGPIAAVRRPQDLWLCASPDFPVTYWTQLLAELRPRVRHIAIASPHEQLLAAADIPIPLPPTAHEWPYTILAAVAGQVAALELGERVGVDVDAPFGLRKVTLTN